MLKYYFSYLTRLYFSYVPWAIWTCFISPRSRWRRALSTSWKIMHSERQYQQQNDAWKKLHRRNSCLGSVGEGYTCLAVNFPTTSVLPCTEVQQLQYWEFGPVLITSYGQGATQNCTLTSRAIAFVNITCPESSCLSHYRGWALHSCLQTINPPHIGSPVTQTSSKHSDTH